MNIKAAVDPTTAASTTGERTIKIGVMSAISCIVLAVASAVSGNPQLFPWKSGVLVTIANMVVVFIPNLLSKSTPNI